MNPQLFKIKTIFWTFYYKQIQRKLVFFFGKKYTCGCVELFGQGIKNGKNCIIRELEKS